MLSASVSNPCPEESVHMARPLRSLLKQGGGK